MTQEKEIIRVEDVMTEDVIYIDGMATAREAAAAMRANKCRCLIVQKRHADDAWGLVAVQDFIQGVLLADRFAAEVNVFEIMTKPVITVPFDMDIRYAARLLFRAGIRRAPVEKNGELAGIISLSSLIINNELF